MYTVNGFADIPLATLKRYETVKETTTVQFWRFEKYQFDR